MAVPAGGHPRDGVRLRLPAGDGERAHLSPLVQDRLSQAAGRFGAADRLAGCDGLQPILLCSCGACRGPARRPGVEAGQHAEDPTRERATSAAQLVTRRTTEISLAKAGSRIGSMTRNSRLRLPMVRAIV